MDLELSQAVTRPKYAEAFECIVVFVVSVFVVSVDVVIVVFVVFVDVVVVVCVGFLHELSPGYDEISLIYH